MSSPPPQWDNVPFDVGCARCGHDLRGLSEPRCPACALRFDWADAVPIERLKCAECGYHLYGLREPRCPECGTPFTWAEALRAYRFSRQPLFEYHWRDRPVRSLTYSASMALRPWKLWRTVSLHDPPAPTGLLVLLVVVAFVFVTTFPAIAYPAQWLVDRLNPSPVWITPGARRVIVASGSAPRFTWRRGYWAPWSIGLWWFPGWLLFIAAWSTAGYLALLALPESMRRCRVRAGHVFRAYVHALLPLAAGQVLFCLFVALAETAAAAWPRLGDHPAITAVVFGLPPLVWFWTILSLALAYRRYIRMKHAWGVALLSQLIALLFAACVVVLPHLWGWW